jgi:hypothetical protein
LRRTTTGFPHVINALLTDEVINESNYNASHIHRSVFTRSSNGRITALIFLRALSGTKANVIWNPGDHEDSTEFETSDDYWHWPHIDMQDLPNGLCSIEYRLDNIRWCTIPFELNP